MKIKEIGRHLLPPVIRQFRISLMDRVWRKHNIGMAPFIAWWRSYKTSNSLPADLRAMIEHFVNSSESKLMSNYWWFLAKRNIEQLNGEGYENFKQTIARNYYTWVGDDANFLMRNVDVPAAIQLVQELTIPIGEIYRKHEYFSLKESLPFNLNTILMYCALGAPKLLDEPNAGNPPGIYIKEKLITQDLLNSYLDYQSISKCCDFSKTKCMLELGAGYGRTAYYILSMHPDLAYIVVDIPPALYVAQRYLSNLFPDKSILRFKSDVSTQEIRKAISSQALIFLTPDQVKRLDDKLVDVWVAIDNLHAMKLAQVTNYLQEADRIAHTFYFTYWPGMPMPYDDYVHDVSTWPIPGNWTLMYKETTYIPSCYVNVCYRVG